MKLKPDAFKLALRELQHSLEESEPVLGCRGIEVQATLMGALKIQQVPAATVANVRPGDNLTRYDGFCIGLSAIAC